MIRVAAVGDLHVGTDSRGLIEPGLADLADHADVLLIAGDLSRVGTIEEIDVFVHELRDVDIPKVAVLGNHDHHHGIADELANRCERGGIAILEGRSITIDHAGCRLGVAGIKGFGGGFPGTSLNAFGEQPMKDFARCASDDAELLANALADLDADRTVVLMHYAPIRATLQGEPPEIYPFLGSGRFAEVIDQATVDLVIHGHAHHGSEVGATPAGVPVRNVAQPVIGDCYRVFQLGTNQPPDARSGLTPAGRVRRVPPVPTGH